MLPIICWSTSVIRAGATTPIQGFSFFSLRPVGGADVGLQTAVNYNEEETCFDFAHQGKDLFKGSVLKILFLPCDCVKVQDYRKV